MVITPFEVMQDNSAKRTDSLAIIFLPATYRKFIKLILTQPTGPKLCGYLPARIGNARCTLHVWRYIARADNDIPTILRGWAIAEGWARNLHGHKSAVLFQLTLLAKASLLAAATFSRLGPFGTNILLINRPVFCSGWRRSGQPKSA